MDAFALCLPESAREHPPIRVSGPKPPGIPLRVCPRAPTETRIHLELSGLLRLRSWLVRLLSSTLSKSICTHFRFRISATERKLRLRCFASFSFANSKAGCYGRNESTGRWVSAVLKTRNARLTVPSRIPLGTPNNNHAVAVASIK